MKRKRSPRRQGNALVVTLATITFVTVFVSLSIQYTSSITRNVRRSILLRQATNIGDASTEMAFSAWRAICRQNQSRIYKRSDLDTEIPTPTPGNFPGVTTYTLTNYAIYPLDSNWNTKTGGAATPAPIAGPNHGDLSYYYLASADVIIPTVNSKNATDPNDVGNVTVRVRRVFQKETISLWRYAIFFNDDLEIHPGAPMVVNGDVQTNGNLYTGHNTLTLNGKTTYVGDWTIGFMPGDSTHPETPTSPTWAAGLPPAQDQAQQPYGVQLSDYHQLIDYTTSSTPLDPYRFQTQAGIIVTIDSSNNVRVYKADGSNVTGTTMGTTVKNAITTNQTITDNREGYTTGNGTIRLATLDVSMLTTAVNNGTLGSVWNGMIYIVDTSADPNGVTAKRAIRLKNGGTLPSGGMVIASGNPVYVQGDFNTGSSNPVSPGVPPVLQPLSNTGIPTSPTVTGYTKQPAAIIGDAVNILSNSWLDSKSGTVPAASPTTVNAGIISGNVPTGNGYYSGGVENFPRFLEDWSNKTFTYYGSMIQLYQSKQSIGHWGAPNVYSPPNRAWYFDDSFVASPPPGVLVSYNYRRSRWYTQ
jgi:hypothetical protein